MVQEAYDHTGSGDVRAYLFPHGIRAVRVQELAAPAPDQAEAAPAAAEAANDAAETGTDTAETAPLE
jgi:hypothetical protein